MATNGKLESLITVDAGASGYSMSLTDDSGGPTVVSLPAGDYYPSSDGSGGSDLMEALESAANAAMGETWSFAADTSENGTGRCTISCTGTVCTVAFSGTNLRDLLGFDGDASGDTSYTGAKQIQALWLASYGWQKKNGKAGGSKRVSDQQSRTNSSGYVFTVQGRDYKEARILWPMELRSKCWTEDESLGNESFETFLYNCIWGKADWASPTGPIRFYPDADDDTTYGTFKALGLDTWDPVELVEHFSGGRWAIELPKLIEVPS